jgi:FtsH-binding integral membrane protein
MSHTTIMLLAGLALLILLRLTIRDAARATRLFLILWLLVSIGNLLVGVLHAGYGWAEEAGIALLVFGVPAALALLARRFWR